MLPDCQCLPSDDPRSQGSHTHLRPQLNSLTPTPLPCRLVSRLPSDPHLAARYLASSCSIAVHANNSLENSLCGFLLPTKNTWLSSLTLKPSQHHFPPHPHPHHSQSQPGMPPFGQHSLQFPRFGATNGSYGISLVSSVSLNANPSKNPPPVSV